jgi:choice-of-anchor B domain-containing protein
MLNGALATVLMLGLSPAVTTNFSHLSKVADGKGSGSIGRGGGSVMGVGEYSSVNVSLHAQLDLAFFGASNGNDVWGYVSPSGREYAFMGLNNKIAFVEVTDPANPVYFANIPHTSSTWADLENYGTWLYVGTEATASGLQVIDISDIDNHNVTLHRTISNPGRTHTLSIDQTSGFLYTNGSRNSGGTFTACFNLADPSNPLRVGDTTMTPGAYQHDTRPWTFTSGPYAGRQILFGSGEGRGVEIWDVTDKSNPFLIVRRTYPNVGYCHQSWLSPDAKYMYVNDEFDESENNILTRTLVFDVSDITNPILLNTFTTGLPTVDHNLYWHAGYVFESNYTSGVRIFDVSVNPTNPTEVGWFDTYPQSDSVTYNGTWSNYPFLPSGTLLVADINRGLFILDPSAATVKPVEPTSFQIVRGTLFGGNINSLKTQDGNALIVRAGFTLSPTEPPIQTIVNATANWEHASKLKLDVAGWANTSGVGRRVEMFDWDANAWVNVSEMPAGTSLSTVSVQLTNPDRFIQDGTRLMRAKVSIYKTGLTLLWPYSYFLDRCSWTINP